MGLFDVIGTTVSNAYQSIFGGGNDAAPDLSNVSGFSDIGSELGGSLQDYLNLPTDSTGQGLAGAVDYVGGLLSGPANSFDLSTLFQNVSGAVDVYEQYFGSGSGAPGELVPKAPPIGTNIVMQQPERSPLYAGAIGGTMNDLVCTPRPPTVPWRTLGRKVHTAAQYFGPAIALQIAGVLAQCYSARTGLTISPIDVLVRSCATRRRRSSGISGRQLRTTRGTLRKLSSMQRYLSHGGYGYARARHRTTTTTCKTRR